MIYHIAVSLCLDKLLSYTSDRVLPVGQLVVVPVRNSLTLGVVVKVDDDHTQFAGISLKAIHEILPYIFPSAFIHFLEKSAVYTMIPLGQLLSMSLIAQNDLVKVDEVPALPIYDFNAITLNTEQQHACDAIMQAFDTFHCFMLDGVTGSGKTEVYFTAIHQLLKKAKKALVLLPEIALTEAIVQRFEQAFGQKPFVWHSNITKSQKRKLWKTLMQPGPAVILGARSALFLPFHDLGLIVVDEEHDSSYKQDEQGIYNARDLAILRCYHGGCPVVLGSATPSLETYQHALDGKYTPLVLRHRYGMAHLPEITLIDKREHKKQIISPPLYTAIYQTLTRGEQTLLFLNRRGYAPLLLCVQCGFKMACPGCHIPLNLHQTNDCLLCHYCGHVTDNTTQCPKCQQDSLKDIGIGVEKLEEEAHSLFPEARILCLSSDMMMTPKLSQQYLAQIADREIDIIVGTQILAKGHHFPYLTCVGIVDADFSLSQMDLRAGEKTFQLLSQVSGRAGRMATHKGHMYLQTYDPANPLFQALQRYDRDTYYAIELADRKDAHMPPFARLISLTLSSLREDILWQTCRALAQQIPHAQDVEVLGPTEAPLYRLQSRYRVKFLIKGEKHKNLQHYTQNWLSVIKIPAHVRLYIDVDPLSFL